MRSSPSLLRSGGGCARSEYYYYTTDLTYVQRRSADFRRRRPIYNILLLSSTDFSGSRFIPAARRMHILNIFFLTTQLSALSSFAYVHLFI